MNSVFEKNAPAKNTAPWLKWLLLILLFASTIAGYFLSPLMIRKFTTGNSSVFKKKVGLPKAAEFHGFMAFREKTGFTPSEIKMICHGMGIGQDGTARAVIDGKILKPGTIIRGMRLLEINASNILVECNGKILSLSPGERFVTENNAAK